MTDHLPVAAVVLPMIAAPLLVIIGHRSVVRYASIAVAWTVFAMCAWLLMWARAEGVVRYDIGGWEPPYGIEYSIDVLGGYVMSIVSFVSAVVLTASGRSVVSEVPANKHTLFYATFLLCLTGLLGMCATGDLFNVFVFLEISSLSQYALISLGRSRRALLASLQYLIVGTVGATFFLIGIGLLYQLTGTLNIADLADRLPRESGSRTLLVALAMMAVGQAIKMAVFPVHTWLPNAYAEAPSVVTAFVAATSTKVSVYAFVRIVYTIYGHKFAFDLLPLDTELTILALFGIYVASGAAIFQTDVKRILAYSSVAQIGYMILGVSLDTPDGLAGGLVHLLNHAMIKGALFLGVAAVVYRIGSSRLEDWRGIGRTMPVTALAIAVAGLALIGVPLTCGFVTKWMLMTAMFRAGHPMLAALMVGSSLLAVVYVWRIVETMYFATPRDVPATAGPNRDCPVLVAATWVLAGGCVWFGVVTRSTADPATAAAEQLFQRSPVTAGLPDDGPVSIADRSEPAEARS